MTVNRLFLRKLLVAFVVGAAPPVIAYVSTIGPTSSISRSAVFTVVSGALAAGVRAALVLIPGVTLVPSDAQPVLTPAPVEPVRPKRKRRVAK